MPKNLCVVILFGLLSSLTAASEQPTDEAHTIYIYTTSECEPDAQALLEKVKSNLAAYSFEYKLVPTPLSEFAGLRPNQTYASLAGTCPQLTYVSIVGHSLDEVSQISPVLFSTYNFNPVGDTSYISGNPTAIEFSATYLTAVSLYSTNQCEEAKPYFETLLQMIEDDINITGKTYRARIALPFYLANCAILADNYFEAITYYQQALQRNGDMLDIYAIYPAVNLAWTYLQIDDEQKALETADAALQTAGYWAGVTPYWRPFNTEIRAHHAQIYALSSKFDEALADMNAVIGAATEPEPSYNPTIQFIVSLYLTRGKMYLAQYEWDSALADYNKAIELDPTYPDAYYERGVLYYSILQTGVELRSEAFSDFHRYIELAPDGDHAADALRYAAQIEKELEALNG